MQQNEKDDGMEEILEHYQNYAERSRFSKFVPYIALGSGLLAVLDPLFLLGPYSYIGFRISKTMNASGLEKPLVYVFWLPMVSFGLVKKAVMSLWK